MLVDTFKDNYKSPNSYKCLVYGTKGMENGKQDSKHKIIKWGMKWHVSRHYDLGAYDFLKSLNVIQLWMNTFLRRVVGIKLVMIEEFDFFKWSKLTWSPAPAFMIG